MTQLKKNIKKEVPKKAVSMVETIFGCKWSLTIYSLIRTGVHRPGELVRSVEGLTTKVLNTCLKRNLDFGILEKKSYHEIPPRVEYHLTDFGKKFIKIIDDIEALESFIYQNKL